MWYRYDEPPFVLSPEHAAAFRDAAATLSESVGWEEWEDNWSNIGVSVFDNLSQAQKQAATLEVAQALLNPNVEPPKVTAVLAGTVDAIYRQMEGNIEIEIDMGEGPRMRSMVLIAMEEMDYWNQASDGLEPDEPPLQPPRSDCPDFGEWSDLVESLRTEVLEDYDFEMADKFLDMPPPQAAALKESMNILPDYFSAVSEDPTTERLASIRQELKKLLRESD